MKSTTKIKNFCILGERNSGTNFLHTAIELNFGLKNQEVCNKHFWRNESELEKHETTAIIVIIRNIFDWINSMHRSPFHLQPELKSPKNKLDFLNKQFWSVYDNADEHGKWVGNEIIEDRHLITHNKYKNIFQARYIKYEHIIRLQKQNNNHIYLIKYEDLNDEYEKNMKLIADYYGIKFKHSEIKKVNTYRGFKKSQKMIDIKPKPKIFSETEITSHKDFNLNKEIKFGYKNDFSL